MYKRAYTEIVCIRAIGSSIYSVYIAYIYQKYSRMIHASIYIYDSIHMIHLYMQRLTILLVIINIVN